MDDDYQPAPKNLRNPVTLYQEQVIIFMLDPFY